MKKTLAPGNGAADLPVARLASIPISAGDALLLPIHGFLRMWSVGLLKAALVLIGAMAVGLLPAVAIGMVSAGPVAQTAQSAVLMLAVWIGMMPLLRATARDEGCGWHLDETEQPGAGTAFGRLALTAILWQIASTVVLAAMQPLSALLSGGNTTVQLVLYLAIALTLAPMLALLSAAALSRNAVESRSAFSSLQETLRGVQWMNALKAATLGSVIPTLIAVACGVVLFLMLRATILGMKQDVAAGLLMAFVLVPMMVVGYFVKHPVFAGLVFFAVTLPCVMFSLGTLLEYLDRIHERDADDSVDAGPASGPSPAREGGAGGRSDGSPHAAAPPAAAAGAPSSPPSPWQPLVMPAGTAPAAAAAKAWSAHRELRRVEDEGARAVMLENGRVHIEAIVACRTADEALLVYRDCAAIDPAFDPGPAARVGLARSALGDHQPELALSLLSGFDKRFAGHPQVPVAYGLAHEALTATGRHDLAMRVLAAMRRRHPDHPMTARLEEMARAHG